MKKIIVIRHCSAIGQKRDDELTTDGKDQANTLATFLLENHLEYLNHHPIFRFITVVKSQHFALPLNSIQVLLTLYLLIYLITSYLPIITCYSISSIVEPSYYYLVVSYPKWPEAMAVEIAALEANNTWTLTPIPSNKKPIGYKWVYRVKYKIDGSMEQYKVKLVAKGFTQKERVDFNETF